MGTGAESVSEAAGGGNHSIHLLLPGYPEKDADRLLSILKVSGQPACLHQSPEKFPVDRRAGGDQLNVVVIHLDHLSTPARDVLRWVQQYHPRAGIILATGTPQRHTQLAEEFRVPDLIDGSDLLRIALAIRRSFRRIGSQREQIQTRALSAPGGNSASDFSEQHAKQELHAVLRPLVSLDGDSRAHYLISPAVVREPGNTTRPESRIQQIPLCGQSPDLDNWLVQRAAEVLARLGEKAGLHLGISEQSLREESTLLRTCESLRRFKVRANNLYFDFDAALLRTEDPHFLEFLAGLRKINCHITCSNVKDSPEIAELLCRHGVHMAQYADSTIDQALDQTSDPGRLEKTNRAIQHRGIKTLAGNITNPEKLALLWELRVNYAWGDFLCRADRLNAASQSHHPQQQRKGIKR